MENFHDDILSLLNMADMHRCTASSTPSHQTPSDRVKNGLNQLLTIHCPLGTRDLMVSKLWRTVKMPKQSVANFADTHQRYVRLSEVETVYLEIEEDLREEQKKKSGRNESSPSRIASSKKLYCNFCHSKGYKQDNHTSVEYDRMDSTKDEGILESIAAMMFNVHDNLSDDIVR
ncbi:hypothetical protein AC1031_012483 [Aphanomyces cochlioides]|nr:hypothetical protein AC1031_012483 [Aphanomyces cochlioides]